MPRPAKLLPLVFAILLATPLGHAQINPEWTTALKPFKIAGNLYYVGSRDLAAYLVTTPAGNILINEREKMRSSPAFNLMEYRHSSQSA